MNTIYQNTLEFALFCDQIDSLNHFRDLFHIPKFNNKDVIYMCGNSLGLQSKTCKNAIEKELQKWSSNGVEGHFTGENPWLNYHSIVKDKLATIVGANPTEVVAMNSLTVNLHLLLTTFYNATKNRNKIIVESSIFSSDLYAINSQIQLHGLDSEAVLIELKPRENEILLNEQAILDTIYKHNDEVALVLLGGVNYYTGQFLDLKAISKAAHDVGAYVGFDLAHAIGNVELNLHNDEIDFAVWCSYKYLNSGPGGVGGAFIHDKHCKNTSLKRLAGWWGHQEFNRFEMPKTFQPIPNADGWQLSNAPILSLAIQNDALSVFSQTSMRKLRDKSIELTLYLYFLLEPLEQKSILTIITPKDPSKRGCQVSISMDDKGKELHQFLSDKGIICDWREPNVLRIAPVPLYNSFQDVFKVGLAINEFVTIHFG